MHSASEAAELLFETSEGTHTYLLYYLPFDDAPCVTGPASSCTSRYGASGGFFFGGRARSFRSRARSLRARWRWDGRCTGAKNPACRKAAR